MSRALDVLTVALSIVVAALLALLAIGGLHAALAAEPTNCAFAPPTLDNFQEVGRQSTYAFDKHNQVLCAINLLQRRAKLSGVAEMACEPVTVAAGARTLVNVGLASPVTGTEPVTGSVIDTTNPARLELDGIQGASGTTATAWVFNRDGTNARTGKVCLSVVRP